MFRRRVKAEPFQMSGRYYLLVSFLATDVKVWTNLAAELTDGELKIETVRTVAVMRRVKGWVGVPLGST